MHTGGIVKGGMDRVKWCTDPAEWVVRALGLDGASPSPFARMIGPSPAQLLEVCGAPAACKNPGLSRRPPYLVMPMIGPRDAVVKSAVMLNGSGIHAPVVEYVLKDYAALSPAQLHVLNHALGLDWKDLPYRNGFKAPPGHVDRGTCETLEADGLMSRTEDCFFVTSRGFQLMFGRDWKAMKARAEE